MLTPRPTTPRAAQPMKSTPPSSPPARNRATQPMMSTPPSTPPARNRDFSPPPAPGRANGMLKALRRHRLDEVESLMHSDDMVAHVPLAFQGRCEPPLFIALRTKCPTSIVKVLLRSGAQADQTGSHGITPLAALGSGADACAQDVMGLPMPPTDVRHCINPTPAAYPLPGLQFFGCNAPFTLPMNPQGGLAAPRLMPQMPVPGYKIGEDYELAVAKILLQHGADAWQKDNKGLSAIDYAEQSDKPKLASLLRNWHQWKECCLQFRLSVLPHIDERASRHIFEFLVPQDWQIKLVISPREKVEA